MIWDTVPDLDIVAKICNKDIDRDLEVLIGCTIVPANTTAADAFVLCNLISSKSEVRRLLKQNATLLISGVKVIDGRIPLVDFPSDKDRWVMQRSNAEVRVAKLDKFQV